MSTDDNSALATMARINRAWLDGRVDDMAPMVHPDVIMVFPGFAGRFQGREMLLGGFRDFCHQATVHDFQEHDAVADVVGDTTVVSIRFEMVYERESQRFKSTGRDVWIFQKSRDAWIAVWRTMLDIEEHPA